MTVTSGVSGVCDNDIRWRQKMRGHAPADPQYVPVGPLRAPRSGTASPRGRATS